MGDVREQAAKAAREWHANTFGSYTERGLSSFIAGYTQGHSAGFSEGARAFAEMVIDEDADFHDYSISKALARFLAAHAGTGIATGDGKEEEG